MAENFEKNNNHEHSDVLKETLNDLNTLKNDNLDNVENNVETTWEALNKLGKDVVNSKIDELQNKVVDTIFDKSLDSNLMWESNNKIAQGQVEELFESWKNEFNDSKNTVSEYKVGKKYDKLKARGVDVKKWIKESANKIVNEINNWEQEKNPVARSLLKFVNRIMQSEK